MYPTAGFFLFLNYGHRNLFIYLCRVRNLLLRPHQSARGLIGHTLFLKADMVYTHLSLQMALVWSLA